MLSDYDYILIGGGLQNGLVARALAKLQPTARVALIERCDRLGGNHTWSFHLSDLPKDSLAIFQDFVVSSWPEYLVCFPGQPPRAINLPYASITSDHFDRVVRDSFTERDWTLFLGETVVSHDAQSVTLASGERLTSKVVIASCGPVPTIAHCGYQNFYGIEFECEQPWPEYRPVIMDACIPQATGYHFIYVLPFSEHRVLVEDTYFCDEPKLDVEYSQKVIQNYVRQQGMTGKVLREEQGSLPMPWSDTETLSPLSGGYAGGWFHPATGYSFPVAVKYALAVANSPADQITRKLLALRNQLKNRARFARFLNWLLFRQVDPLHRWQIFERLYRTLPPSVMARFYGMEFTPTDALRMLIGRPPRMKLLRTLPWLRS